MGYMPYDVIWDIMGLTLLQSNILWLEEIMYQLVDGLSQYIYIYSHEIHSVS